MPTISKLGTLIFLYLLLQTQHSYAQFMGISIEIEPGIKTEVISNLSFGNLSQSSLASNIGLGDPGMGVYGITSYQNEEVIVQLDAPRVLRNRQSPGHEGIFLNLQAAYANRGKNDYKDAIQLKGNNAQFQILDPKLASKNENKGYEAWETAYIYIYGGISIENIRTGIYEGDITLRIIYQ